jgi:hypothetical protein
MWRVRILRCALRAYMWRTNCHQRCVAFTLAGRSPGQALGRARASRCRNRIQDASTSNRALPDFVASPIIWCRKARPFESETKRTTTPAVWLAILMAHENDRRFGVDNEHRFRIGNEH